MPPSWGIACSLILVMPLAVALLPPGWFVGDDNLHLIRLFEQDVMIRGGHFPVRWYPDVAGGFGSPHPQFYAPLYLLVAQIFHLAGLPLALSLKLTVVAALGAASLGMFLLVREHAGSGAGLVAAALYSYAPYHLLDLFVRTAFSELAVFSALPWVLMGFHRLARGPTATRVAGAAAALGALCLAHTITLMLIPPLLGSYVVALAWGSRFAGPSIRTAAGAGGTSAPPGGSTTAPSRGSFLASAAAAAILGVALAAFFLVPLVAESGSVDTEVYAQRYFSYPRHFVAPAQLLFSPWGHGISREGLDDGISFRLGLLQIAGFIAGLASLQRLGRSNPAAAPVLIWAALVSAAGIFMTLGVSEPVWRLVQPLRFVQFPWRFLMLPAFGMPLMGGLAIAVTWGARAGGWGKRGASARARDRISGDARARDGSATNVRGNVRGGASPEAGEPLDPGPRWAALATCAAIILSSAGMFGFRQWVPLERIGFGGDHTDMEVRGAEEAAARPTVFTREFIREQTLHWWDHLPPGNYPYPSRRDALRPRIEMAAGRGEVEILSEDLVRYVARVREDGPVTLRVNVYTFPGWTLRIDGEPAEPGPSIDPSPTLSLEVPPGEHVVEAAFERTPARWAGDLTSLAALAVTVMLAAAGLRRRAAPSPGRA